MRLLLPLLATALLVPAPAFALELAVQDDAVVLHRSYGNAELALDRARDLGATRVRANVSWSGVLSERQAKRKRRPTRVDYDFSRLERLHRDAAARGLQLQVTLTGPAPAWATGDRKVSYTRPGGRHFAHFARALATTFAGRIDRYSIWNEPNWNRHLRPTRSAPRLYRDLYRRAYDAIKAADDGAEVLMGELMPGANTRNSVPALRFLRGVTCSRSDWRARKSCAPLKADGFALHPYNFAKRPKDAVHPNRDIPEMGSLSRLTRALDRLRKRGALRTPSDARMPVFLTEFGYFTDGPVAQKPKTHARWLAEAWDIARRNLRVRQLLQYGLIDPWPKRVTWRTAIMKKDGTPRLAYRSLQRRVTR